MPTGALVLQDTSAPTFQLTLQQQTLVRQRPTSASRNPDFTQSLRRRAFLYTYSVTVSTRGPPLPVTGVTSLATDDLEKAFLQAAEIAKKAYQDGSTLRAAALQLGYLTEEQFKKLANQSHADYRALIWFLYDSGISILLIQSNLCS